MAILPQDRQRAIQLIRAANTILVITHQRPDGDALGSALGLSKVLTALGKKVTTYAGGHLPSQLSFLPGFNELPTELTLQRDLLIMLSESSAKVGNISLKRLRDQQLVLVVSAKEGAFSASDVRIDEGTLLYDLVISVDASSPEQLPILPTQWDNLRSEIPSIVIDHHTSTTIEAEVVLSDSTAAATAEILVSLTDGLSHGGPSQLSKDVATCYLTGILDDTKGFRNTNATSKVMTVAAQLVAAGADNQLITKKLFAEKSIATLRLWGRALAYAKLDATRRFAWTVLTEADYAAAGVSPTDGTEGLIDNLLKQIKEADYVALFIEREGEIYVSMRNEAQALAAKVAEAYGGGGHAVAAAFRVGGPLTEEKEAEIVSKITIQLDLLQKKAE
jgi:phosphoesterase RecJ-like protein